MPLTTGDLDHVTQAVRALDVRDRPRVVGISGFGGAGKSTLAAALQKALPGAVVVPGDEFMRARPAVGRSDDWHVVDRDRLCRQVLLPARRGEPVRYQVWDPASGAPGPWVDAGRPSAVIVEGCGLYVPDLVGLFDLRVWMDVDLEAATARGMWRDEHVHHNGQANLWRDVWVPNDADFFARFRPDLVADVLFRAS